MGTLYRVTVYPSVEDGILSITAVYPHFQHWQELFGKVTLVLHKVVLVVVEAARTWPERTLNHCGSSVEEQMLWMTQNQSQVG